MNKIDYEFSESHLSTFVLNTVAIIQQFSSKFWIAVILQHHFWEDFLTVIFDHDLNERDYDSLWEYTYTYTNTRTENTQYTPSTTLSVSYTVFFILDILSLWKK